MAIFVAIGIPVSFLGGLAVMPLFDISLNLLSMFAFIMVLGIVVDDAIVTGENIFNHLRRGGDRSYPGRAGGAALRGDRLPAGPRAGAFPATGRAGPRITVR